jgi:[acyl-carrier-protein] S-malonyltransferase
MGKALYDAFPAAREVFEISDRVLGLPLTKVIFEGPEETLNRTDMAQPALLTVEVAAWRALISRWQPLPEVCLAAGHSLGEYAAWVAAGVLSLETALKTVQIRGQLMQAAAQSVQGGMAAVLGSSAEEVKALCQQADAQGGVQPANYNCPGQVVISGSNEALERFKVLAAEKKVKVMPLKVSGPFHSKFMQSAGEGLAEHLRQVTFVDAKFPVVANVTADAVSQGTEVPGLLVQQVSGSVRWEESVRRMAALGVETVIELGPGKVLRGLIKKIAPEMKSYGAFSAEEIDSIVGMMQV